MKIGADDLETRWAVAGEYLPPSHLETFSEPEGPSRSLAPRTLVVEDYQQFMRPAEQKFYDWCIGLLEDAGVVGAVKNESLYLDTALSGQLEVGHHCYDFELSRTSINFDTVDDNRSRPPIRFSQVIIETEESEIEASQVGKAFVSIRRQSILNRVWASFTSLASYPLVSMSDIRLGQDGSLTSMDIETSLGECTVKIRRGPQGETFRYSVFHALGSTELSPRIADALLADVAEDLGASPVPESILDAMIGVAARARADQEWLSVGLGGPDRPRLAFR